MFETNDTATSPINFELLLPVAVGKALKEERFEDFSCWMRENLRNFMDPKVFPADTPADLVRGMAYQVGLMIWNAMPLPGNDFRPRPLPLPGRNDSCPCGSSRKHKHCCANPRPPSLSPQLLWPLVLELAPKEQVRQALAQHRLPLEGVLAVAEHYQQQGKVKKAARLLEPLLDPLPKKKHPLHDAALTKLCNLYDELGYWRKKLDLLERLINTPKATPLRASAWQRLAAYRIDHLDVAGAWEAFGHALRDNPDDPSLAILELQLLGAEQRWPEMRDRARFWSQKLRRRDYDPEAIAPLLELLEKTARDPQRAMDELYEEMTEEQDAPASLLRQWIVAQGGRPVLPYAIGSAEEESAFDMTRHLRSMGLKKAEIARAITMLEKQKGELSAAMDEEVATDEQGNAQNELELLAPEALAWVEAGWQKVAKLSKPFSCNEMPVDDWNGWEPGREAKWAGFLGKHPEAFDSLDIIDDLVTVCFFHPDYPDYSLGKKVVLPLLERAKNIIEESLAGQQEPILPWAFPANRPALRSLVRLLMVKRANQAGAEECERLLTWLLRLNPVDNHGLRQLAINEWLQQGRNEEACQLAECYPEDMFAETRYGLVLALYRLNRIDSAQQVAEAAVADLPLVADYLVKKQVRRPKLDARGFRFGGHDQAWLYRKAMREVWQATPGALEWLARIMKIKGIRVD
jgi:tetratricopeptide (TPR) repeat protein